MLRGAPPFSQEGCGWCTAAIFVNAIDVLAVSYTHLDVYKRQALHRVQARQLDHQHRHILLDRLQLYLLPRGRLSHGKAVGSLSGDRDGDYRVLRRAQIETAAGNLR